jgi:hypothetical protein
MKSEAFWLGGLCAVLLAMAAPLPAADDPRDLSGVWLPDSRRSERVPRDLPFTDAARKAVDAYRALHEPIDPTLDDANASCLPEPMPYGMRLLAQYPFEILMTPQRVTVFFEIYGGVRRIFLDGRAPPAEMLPSVLGFSTGRWEGNELVVETTRVKVDGAGPMTGSPPRSLGRRFVERLSIGQDAQGKRELRNVITIHDAAVLREPVTLRMVYKQAAKGIEVGEYLCQQDIWDQNIQGNPSNVPWRH